MHQALYRKYRPSVFDDVYGQEHITSILRHEALNNSVSHAYLFAGSRGTGKTTCAKILAKSVNCLNLKNGNPCNECENCLAIDAGTTTDVIEMDAATNTGVDYIRDLRENVMYTPAMLKKRVYIIDEAHMLSDSAFNALLKTIEEPPEHVLYIFATTEQHKIPATIISRCQRFEFRRISTPSLVERLSYIAECEGIRLTKEGATIIAKTAQGGMRDAISLMELCAGTHEEITPQLVNKLLGTSSYDKLCDIVTHIAKKNYAKIFDAVNEVVISSKDLLVFFADLTSFYRDLMVYKSSSSASYLDLLPNEENMLREASSLFNMATLIHHTTLLDDAYANMMRNPASKRLCAEITLLKMADPRLNESNEALLARIATLEDKLTLISKGAVIAEPTPEATTSAKETEPQATIDELTKEQPKKATQTEVEAWDEVISRVREKDPLTASLLIDSRCFTDGGGIYNVTLQNELMKSMLELEKNKRCLFDAMLLCELNVSSEAQIKFYVNTKKAVKSDLDEF